MHMMISLNTQTHLRINLYKLDDHHYNNKDSIVCSIDDNSLGSLIPRQKAVPHEMSMRS